MKCRERGLRIPEDISIAGYDGITIAKILEPKTDYALSGYRCDRQNSGREADRSD